jgi:galactokinase/mevalonate kinase-like predicted kinase
MLLIKDQADALRDFITNTARHMKKVDARLGKHWEAIRKLISDTSNLSDQLSELDERKQDAPEERELRIAAEQEELERLERGCR